MTDMAMANPAQQALVVEPCEKRVTGPILTIVIPSFNQAKFLDANLREATRWRHLHVEVFVFDGGSTDGSVDIIRSYASVLDRWVSAPDGGQAAAINEGLTTARGEWVAFQNSDDYYVPGALPTVLQKLRESAGFDIVIAGSAFADQAGKVFRRNTPKPIWRIPFCRRNYINNQSLFVRRDFMKRAGVLDPSFHFCLDYEWYCRLLKCQPRIAYMAQIVGVQRFHETTKTSRMQDICKVEFARARAAHYNPYERTLAYVLDPIYRAFRWLYGSFWSS